MASWPWVQPYERLQQSLEEFPGVRRWHETMKARPKVVAGAALGEELRQATPDDEARKILFGQTAITTTAAASEKLGV